MAPRDRDLKLDHGELCTCIACRIMRAAAAPKTVQIEQSAIAPARTMRSRRV